jgi:plastocyanin
MSAAPAKKGNGRTIAIVAVVIIIVAIIAGYYLLYGMGSGKKPTTTRIAVPSGTGASNQALNFSPQTVKVVIGVNNTVTWTNNDSTDHTITFSSAPSGVSLSSLTDSNNLSPGTSYSLTLTTAGTYQFHCEIHSWMHGTITVLASS